jgi:Insertion element 4 transposase N-terminal
LCLVAGMIAAYDAECWCGWWRVLERPGLFGVLASSVPRDVIDDVVVACGRQAKRADGKLPPHVMVFFSMAMALFADEDYEEVAARLAGTLGVWRCWDARWGAPTSGGITRARERLGFEPLAGIFAKVAVPVADLLTQGRSWGPGG